MLQLPIPQNCLLCLSPISPSLPSSVFLVVPCYPCPTFPLSPHITTSPCFHVPCYSQLSMSHLSSLPSHITISPHLHVPSHSQLFISHVSSASSYHHISLFPCVLGLISQSCTWSSQACDRNHSLLVFRRSTRHSILKESPVQHLQSCQLPQSLYTKFLQPCLWFGCLQSNEVEL